MSKEYDVIIVGAGVSGALTAWKLGEKGYKVLLLEAGIGRNGLARRQEWVDRFRKNPIKTPNSPYPVNDKAPTPDAGHPNAYYRYRQPDGKPSSESPAMGPVPGEGIVRDELSPSQKGSWFQSTYNRTEGGTTWHWLGTSFRFAPNDFKLKSTYGRGFDWPINYDEIEPWYTLAEHTIGIAGPPKGETDFGKFRSAPYPMPEVPQSYADMQVVAAVQGQKFHDPWTGEAYPLEVSPTPQSRNTTPGYGGRPQCKGSSSCIPICPIQAKYDATQHVQLALQTGNVELICEAVTYKVLVESDQENAPARGVVYRDYQMQDHEVSGKIVILAAHAIENAKILLNSPWKEGVTVANSSDQVGRNLADHPVSLIYAMVDDPLYPYRGPLSTSGIESLKDGPFRKYRGAFRMEMGNDGWLWPTYGPYNTPVDVMTHYGKTPSDLINEGKVPVYGKELAETTSDLLSRQHRFGCLAEQLPNENFRVKLPTEPFNPRNPDYEAFDHLGLPRPILSYGIDEYAKRSLNASVDACVQVYKQMIREPRIQYNYVDDKGAIQIDTERSDPPAEGQPYGGYNIFVREGWSGAGHVMGTHRMGDDPKDSVTDKYQRCWDHKNLFLLGSGLWPSYTASNPTQTIMALSLWAADTIDLQLQGKVS